jgi:small basic protein
MSAWKRGNAPAYDRIIVPRDYLGMEAQKDEVKHSIRAKLTNNNHYDTPVYFVSIFLREFVSTICLLVLSSRLSGDLFIAGPVVTLYVNIVFRRPLNNPFVATLACMSSGDWRDANVAGYPGFNKKTTPRWKLFLYWLLLLTAELLGAVVAALIRASNDNILGYEFIKGAAWGTGQMYMRANVNNDESCWNKSMFPSSSISEIPVRLYRDTTETIFKSQSCLIDTQMRWWFTEDLSATLFLIVAYVHIWRCLRWDDMQKSNPSPMEGRYWEKIITFSIASASLGIMTAMAFPTANAGLHTSVFLATYEKASSEKQVASNTLKEPLIRACGGMIGCLLAVIYEWIVSWLDSVEKKTHGGEGEVQCCSGDSMQADEIMHKLLYLMPVPTAEVGSKAAV